MIAAFIDGLFRYQFLQNALLTSIIVGLISGVIGSFIILRGMSLMGDAISHAVLPGVAVSYMFGFNYIFGASIFGLLAALSIGFITQKSPLKNDTAIGVVFSSFFALGIIFISFAKSSTDLYHILFGNVLAVVDTDILITCVVGVIVLIFVALFYKELQLTSFDPTMARLWFKYSIFPLCIDVFTNISRCFFFANRRNYFSHCHADYTSGNSLSINKSLTDNDWLSLYFWDFKFSDWPILQLFL